MSLSLSRGIDTLRLINHLHAVLPGDVTKHLNIPRATVYRILGTLVEKGLLYRQDGDGRYRMTTKVSGLSSGFSPEDRLAEISRPLLKELTEHFTWPVTLATIEGSDLIIRENTDYSSPLAVEQFNVGFKMSVLESASGQCILAFMVPEQREKVLAQLKSETNRKQVLAKRPLNIKKIRAQGFAINYRSRKISDMTAIAVPVICNDYFVAAMTVRYARAAIPEALAIKQFIPLLYEKSKQLAHQIDI